MKGHTHSSPSGNSVPVPLPVTLVDACQYGQLGLRHLLADPAGRVGEADILLHTRVESALSDAQKTRAVRGPLCPGRCLVLRLPTHPGQALQQLLCLDGALLAQAGFRRLVVLSAYEVNNVIRQALVCCDVRVPVRIINARAPVAWLRRVVLSQGTLLQAGEDEHLPWKPALVLSVPERRVLSETLLEISIHRQARMHHRNNKTLYAQRHNALRKFCATGLSGLLRRFAAM
ncbi:TPA: hypothetical protein ACGR4L_004309 [Serratia marcescens]|uniref:hypothetical protein n=1 Tax=Serratia marcescens TaxID=615 RepID=UPI0009515058|nr:hypothetical protein [Serratia marcescens]